MEKIVDYIKRSIDEMKMRCAEPAKLQMSTATFCMMLEECSDNKETVTVEMNDGILVYKVCGLIIERRPDIQNGTIFIVS